MRVLSILGYILVAFALCVAVLTVALLLTDQDLTRKAGELWFSLSPSSLNLFQVLVQRFLYPPLWDNVIVPLLLRPAWEVLAIFWAVPLTAGSILLWLGRSRRWR